MCVDGLRSRHGDARRLMRRFAEDVPEEQAGPNGSSGGRKDAPILFSGGPSGRVRAAGSDQNQSSLARKLVVRGRPTAR